MKSGVAKRGFTIVELLIVIVVIAILAAITIVAYNGVQTRAQNTATIAAAKQSLQALESYITLTGNYPLTVTSGNISACITADTGCMDASSVYTDNSTLDSEITNNVGSLPQSVPKYGNIAYGIRYNYYVTRTFDGVSRPVVLQYFLIGSNVPCGVQGVMTGSWSAGVTSTTGYYNSNLSNYSDGRARTQCIVSVDGPSV